MPRCDSVHVIEPLRIQHAKWMCATADVGTTQCVELEHALAIWEAFYGDAVINRIRRVQSLAEVEDRLLRFQDHYCAAARPFEWKFTRSDLKVLLSKIQAHEQMLAMAA